MGSLLHVLSYTGFVLAADGLFALYAWNKLIPQWNRRQFAILRNQWGKIFSISLAASVIMTAVLSALSLPGFLPLLFGGLTFVLVFTGITDSWISYAPLEVGRFGFWWAVFWSAATFLYQWVATGAFPRAMVIQIAAWAVFILIFRGLVIFMPKMQNGLGGADFRTFDIMTFSYAWVLGLQWVAILMFAASVVQLVAHFIRYLLRKYQGTAKGGKKGLAYLPALCGVLLISQLLVVNIQN